MNKLFIFIAIFASLFISPFTLAGEISVDDAWIREAPPVSKVQAAYMELHNKSDKDVSLISASSPHFSRIEFHRTEMSGGVMRMQQQEKLNITANSELKLQPDGMHMMLFNPRTPLKSGDKVPFSLTFSDEQKMEIMIKVKKAGNSHQRQHRCGGH